MTNAATSESVPKPQKAAPSYIKWFHEIGIKDVPIVGGKTASLGEIFRELTPKGVEVPDGFAITAAGYWHSNAGRTVFQTTRAILKTEKQSQICEKEKRSADYLRNGFLRCGN